MAKKRDRTKVMICPKCKSADVDMDKTNPLQPAMGLPPMYICNRCGLSGHIFPEVFASDIKKYEDKARKEGQLEKDKSTPKVDTRY